jgi:DNA-binding MarR family transcriptional regulator
MPKARPSKSIPAGEPALSKRASAEAVAALIEHLTRGLHSMSFSAGLNPAQWNALRYLDKANPSARNVTAFARHHLTKKSTASETISALLKKGLIEKTVDPDDARARSLALTDTGRALLHQDPYRTVLAVLEARPAADLAAITEFLADLLRAVFRDLEPEDGEASEDAP